jgi:flagellar biosynthetic protein FliR
MTTAMVTLGFLAWVRIGAVLLATPLLGSISAPPLFKVLLGGFLSIAVVTATIPNLETSTRVALEQHMPILVLQEAFIGAMLGFGVQTAFATFSLAGSLLDIQIGLGMGSLYDPVLRTQSPILSTTLELFGGVLFFSLGAHREFIAGLANSFHTLPAGSALTVNSLPLIARQFGVMFEMAVVYISPVLLGLLLIEIGLSILSRVLPQMNIIFVGVPVKIVCGLTLLSVIMPLLTTPTSRIFRYLSAYLIEIPN